jgi:hypothetical protein
MVLLRPGESWAYGDGRGGVVSMGSSGAAHSQVSRGPILAVRVAHESWVVGQYLPCHVCYMYVCM